MSRRIALLSSTFLSTWIAGAAFAADVALPSRAVEPVSTRAVDAINGGFEALGGSYATHGFYAGVGKLSVPLGQQFGVQFDAGAGAFANRFLASGGGHLFWRDPRTALVGLYGNYQHWSQYGGVHVARIGAEGEAYLGRFTLHGIAGAEFGNNASVFSTTRTAIANGSITTTTGALDDRTRFFDRASLSYYVTDDWKASIGHLYTGGRNFLTLGTEYARPMGHGTMAALFGEARVGEGHDNYGLWGGARFYFGQKDKSLIRRHREDDPGADNSPDSLFDIANSLGGSTSTGQCTGEFQFNGTSCQPFFVSDCRLKRDVVELARLENGIGLYRFRYLWSDIVYVGVIAQEVAQIRPDAVGSWSDDYDQVDYDKLGLRMMTFEEWTAQNGAAQVA